MAIAAGGRHSVAVQRDGSVVSWGDNLLGQITNAPVGLTNVSGVAAGLWHTLALRADGSVLAWGDLFNRSNAVPMGLSNITAISAGPRHCLALRNDGQVFAWGFSYDFLENYLPTNGTATLTNVIAISAGLEHNEAVRRDGTLVVWGHTNNPAVLGALVLTNAAAVSAGWHYGTVLKTDARVDSWGQNGAGDLGFDSVSALSAGAAHVLMVRTNDNSPVIREQPRDTAVPVGCPATLRVKASSAAALSFQWRKNGVNVSGATSSNFVFNSLQDSDDGDYHVRVSTTNGFIDSRVVRLETIHTPVITNQTPELVLRRPQGTFVYLAADVFSKGTRTVSYQWFRNGASIVSPVLGASYPLTFWNEANEGAYQLVATNLAGSATSAVWQVSVTLRGEAVLWGDNTYGQRTGLSRHDTNLVAMSAGSFFTLALRENGTVHAWGENLAGQTNVPSGLTNVIAIAAGGSHSLALLENGTVRAWGNNSCGQTNVPGGLTNVVAIAAGGPQSLALRRNGTLVAWGCTPVPAGISNVAAIAAGPLNALALSSNGTVQAWNDPSGAVLTPPVGLSNVVALACGSSHALALRQNGTVVSWGANGYGETNVPAGLSNVFQIAAGSQFSLALKNDGTLLAWGRNDLGQTNLLTGLGDVWSISAGAAHAAALIRDPLLNYPVNVAQDLLLIYNTNSSDSLAVKNYYLTNRPFVRDAMVLGIGGFAGETYPTLTQFTNDLLNPLQTWYAQNPDQEPGLHHLLPRRAHAHLNPRSRPQRGEHCPQSPRATDGRS